MRRLAAVGLKSSVVVLIALKALGPENGCFVKLESGLDVCINAHTQVDFSGTVEDWEYSLKLDTRTVVVTHGTSLPLRDRTSPSYGLREDGKGRDSPPPTARDCYPLEQRISSRVRELCEWYTGLLRPRTDS